MKLVLAGDFGGTFTVNRSGAKQSGVVARNNHLRPINLWIVVSHFPSFHAQKNRGQLYYFCGRYNSRFIENLKISLSEFYQSVFPCLFRFRFYATFL